MDETIEHNRYSITPEHKSPKQEASVVWNYSVDHITRPRSLEDAIYIVVGDGSGPSPSGDISMSPDEAIQFATHIIRLALGWKEIAAEEVGP